MSAEHVGLSLLLLLIAAVVLAFVLEIREFLHTPVPADGEETSAQEPDRRVFRRVRAVGGAAALLLFAGVITIELLYPGFTSADFLDYLIHPYALIIYGPIFFIAALLCGAKPRQPVLLVCLTLPGLIVMPLVSVADLALSPLIFVAPFLVFFAFVIQPGLWILLCIGIGQARLLRRPGGNFTLSGAARISSIVIGYLLGMFLL